jgi:segregation and condensation protein B
LAADRGIQLRRRPHGVRIETKPQYADLIGRLLPERKAKPITSQALETLAIVALKQPVSTGDINAIRGIESAGTVQTLRNRKLIARSPRLGPRRERIWRTTQLFLDTFGLASLDELYKEGRMEEVFASVYIAEMVAEAGKAHSNNGAAGDVEAS